MRILIVLVIMASLFMLASNGWAEQTVSQTFTIGAYLPPHPVTGGPAVSTTMNPQTVQGDLNLETTIERIFQGQQEIILQTTVMK